MSPQVSNAIAEALRIIGHVPDRFDVDAVYGALLNAGVHVMDTDDVTAQLFDDRCDFQCTVCHPEVGT